MRIEVSYEGSLRCRTRHAPSGSAFVTDAPVDNRGRGESFSPTDLVAAALGTCMLTVMGIAAEDRGWDLTGASASVEKHMAADPDRRIAKLAVEIRVPLELDERARAVLTRAAEGCPVHRSLSPGVEIPVTFHFGTGA